MSLRRVAVGVAMGLVGLSLFRSSPVQADPPPRPWSLASVQGASAAVARLPMNDDDAVDGILSALRNPVTSFPFDVSRFRTDSRARLQLIQSFGPVLKRIVASPIFRQIYAGVRQLEVRRAVGNPPGISSQLADAREALAEMERQARDPSVPPSVRAQLRPVIEQMRTRIREAEAEANDPAHAQERAAERAAYDARSESAERELDSSFPREPNTLVANRLEAFLTLTATMPWTAQLRPQNGLRVFVDPALEGKDAFWKICFRAGRETVTAARTFAQGWLTQLRSGASTNTPGSGSTGQTGSTDTGGRRGH